jgi:hypothetical protein
MGLALVAGSISSLLRIKNYELEPFLRHILSDRFGGEALSQRISSWNFSINFPLSAATSADVLRPPGRRVTHKRVLP